MDDVATFREPAELAENEPTDRVVRLAVGLELDAVIDEVGVRHKPAHEPLAVR